MSNGLAKVMIVSLEGGPDITAEFNPKELSFSKSVGWSDDSQGTGTDFPALQFTAGKAIKLSVELLFDKFEESGDVRGIVQSVMKLALIRDDLKRPPMVQLIWGSSDVLFTGGNFTGVVTDVTTKYTMFLNDGVPCRAVVSVSLTQAVSVLAGDKKATASPITAHFVGENPTLKDIQRMHPKTWEKIVAPVDDPNNQAQLNAAIKNGVIMTKPSVTYETVPPKENASDGSTQGAE